MRPRRPDPEAVPGDDAEILEIEGLPDDAPPPSATESDDGEDPVRVTGPEADETPPVEASTDVAALREQVKALEEDLLRVRADFENFRRRQDRDRSDLIRRASADLLRDVLPVVDNFRRALDADSEGTPDGYKEGVRMIFEQLTGVLEKAGLVTIRAEGELFDPNLHEAVARTETDDVEPNTITDELEPGYMFRDRLLRPARVRVAVAPKT
ncbi:MAG: nucleotide exchange factor GrpE [Acidobacteriota bacterium]